MNSRGTGIGRDRSRRKMNAILVFSSSRRMLSVCIALAVALIVAMFNLDLFFVENLSPHIRMDNFPSNHDGNKNNPHTNVTLTRRLVSLGSETSPLLTLPSYIDSALSDLNDPYRKGQDLPFFFHIPKAAGTSLLGYLGTCVELVLSTRRGASFQSDTIEIIELEGMRYVNADATTPQGIQHANELHLVSSGKVDLIKTSLFTPSLQLFSPSNKGKMFAMFRHPIERHTSEFYYLQSATHEGSYRDFLVNWTLEEWAQSQYIGQNWVTRMLANKQSGPLNDEDLQLAKEILRVKCLIGLTSKMEESIERIEAYFGWSPKDRQKSPTRFISGIECKEQFFGQHGTHVNRNRHPDVLPNTETWSILQSVNTFDLPLYHYAVQLFEEQSVLFQ